MMNEDNINTEPSKPKRGRPSVPVTWPTSEFTAEEVYNSLEKKLSRVSIHAKINKAIKLGQLTVCGKIKPRTGRPKTVYKRTDLNTSTELQ
mgnify:CR=1 FL=1